jgi:hypothetical protein
MYWVSEMDGKIGSKSTAGGDATEIATGLTTPTAFTTDGTNMYVVSGMSLLRVPIATGTPETVVTEAGAIYDVAFANDTLFYTQGEDVKSVAADAEAGTGAVVATAVGGGQPQGVTIDGTYVLWAATNAYNVESDPIDGDMLVKLGASQAGLIFGHGSLRSDGTYIYWVNGSSILRSGFDSTAELSTMASTLEFDNVSAYDIDATSVYYAAAGNIESAVFAEDSVWLARGQGEVSSLVVDATNIYWSNDSCAIMSTPH